MNRERVARLADKLAAALTTAERELLAKLLLRKRPQHKRGPHPRSVSSMDLYIAATIGERHADIGAKFGLHERTVRKRIKPIRDNVQDMQRWTDEDVAPSRSVKKPAR